MRRDRRTTLELNGDTELQEKGEPLCVCGLMSPSAAGTVWVDVTLESRTAVTH